MWEKTGGCENKPVDLEVLKKFKRMHRFQPWSAVVAALKDSEFLIMEGEEGKETLRRKTAYVSHPEGMKNRTKKSVYIKGFGEETPTTQFDIENWAGKFGKIDRVKLRREGAYQRGPFKGSVFVEFQTEEIAKAFVALDPAPTWEGKGLKIMMKADYIDEKNTAIAKGEIEPSKVPHRSFFEGKEKNPRGGARGRGGRGGHNGDSNDWKKRRDNDQKNGFRGGRGGRGRGRGGRGRSGRDDRNGRDNRNGGDQKKDGAAPKSTNKYVSRPQVVKLLANPRHSVTQPMIQATNANGKPETNSKRTREDDAPAAAPPTKKVDTKSA
jgi:lupus La protein